MSDDDSLANPMQFTIRPRTVNLEKYLRHEDFDDKQVTEVKIEPGQLYVYWEYVDGGDDDGR